MKTLQRTLALLLSLSMLSLSFGQAHAAMVTNNQVIDQLQLTSEKQSLLQTIRRADVQQQLLGLGVSVEDVEARVNMMTQEEIAQLNQQIEHLPAGGDILGVLLVIFIVFVITDAVGATDIFPFIKPVN
jgi:hypothetical protein